MMAFVEVTIQNRFTVFNLNFQSRYIFISDYLSTSAHKKLSLSFSTANIKKKNLMKINASHQDKTLGRWAKIKQYAFNLTPPHNHAPQKSVC